MQVTRRQILSTTLEATLLFPSHSKPPQTAVNLTYDYSINYFAMLQTTYYDQNIRIHKGRTVSHEHMDIMNNCKAILECTTCACFQFSSHANHDADPVTWSYFGAWK
jgi:hypothetical protein